MNTLQRLTRESWKFYLVALAIVLFFVVCDSIYICRDTGIAFMGMSVEQQIRTDIKELQNKGQIIQVPEQGMDLTEVICDRSGTGFFVVIAGIVILMMARRVFYMDIRAQEFRRTLPVKEGSMVLHDYLSMLGVILFGALIQGGILLSAQNHYNRAMMHVLEEQSAGIMKEKAVAIANERTLWYMLIYLLFILLMYTWIYLGMTITKNPIAGVVISLVMWEIIFSLQEAFLYNGLTRHFMKSMDIYMADAKASDICTVVRSLFFPSEFFSNLWWESKTISSDLNLSGCSIWINIGIMIGCIVLMIGLIYLSAGRRELSQGKLFYFSILDYPFAFFCGIFVNILLTEYEIFGFVNSSVVLVTGVVIPVAICLWIHPFSNKRPVQWEVK